MKTTNKNFTKGFTLIEIMIVVILTGLIALFGIPGYSKMVRKAHERNAILGLTTINQANEIYATTSVGGAYLPGVGLLLPAINAELSIDIKALDLDYSYTRNAGDPLLYTATAAWPSGTPPIFTVGVNQNPISGANPYCAGGSCPSL